ncbi:MAG: hypothetical protein ACRC68_18320 [Clostridium sp.]
MGKLTIEEILFIKNNISSVKKDGKVICINRLLNAINEIDNEVLDFDNSDLFQEK